ncbi:hypothetical protein N7G274_007774 [Stereocaulon virgatum]|uniref:Uncharacterized protein n=1 Tax=Stereocaulon virgatum TaxID=373712 RepID=A0ABR4A0P0_9LECA
MPFTPQACEEDDDAEDADAEDAEVTINRGLLERAIGALNALAPTLKDFLFAAGGHVGVDGATAEGWNSLAC